ncbi:MAG: ThiF family adenylyltransferase [Opitutales bacterium]|nr:ThiF family adenylyltransferase [Opitutales bacterium]
MRVYFYEEQLRSFLRESGKKELLQACAVVYVFRAESVAHFYLNPTPVSPYAEQAKGLLLVSPDSMVMDEGENFRQFCQKMPLGNDVEFVLLVLGADDSSAVCYYRDRADCFVRAEVVSVKKKGDFHSRSRGLIEVDSLARKSVCIIGLGSFGAPIALELTKSGVGHLALFDPDRIEPENINRHPCGINDLGRLKVDAVRELVLRKNPSIIVNAFPFDVNEHLGELEAQIEQSDLVVCVTDEKRSRLNTNQLVVRQSTPAIFSRAITRAAGGDVFCYRPGGPCLACLFGQGLYGNADEISTEVQSRRDAPAYMSNTDIGARIQAGLSVDILPIVQMSVKLALVELSRTTELPMSSLEEDLSMPFYIWANRRELIYEKWLPMKAFYNRNSIMRWYGVDVCKDNECLCCAV